MSRGTAELARGPSASVVVLDVPTFCRIRESNECLRPVGGFAGVSVTPSPLVPYESISSLYLETLMSFLKRLFSSNTPEPTQRTRICVECGMPVADHKDWCSIRRGHAEMERRKAEGQ
jgi:hypothetical protein